MWRLVRRLSTRGANVRPSGSHSRNNPVVFASLQEGLLAERKLSMEALVEKDRAFASLLAEKDGKLAEKDGKFASLLVKLLEEKDKTSAERDKTSASLLAAKDLKSEIKDLEASLVQLQHRMDVALGVVTSRAVLEATIDAVWYMLYPPGGAIQKPKVTSMSGRLKHLLGGEPPHDTTPGCLGLLSYLRASAAVNSVPKEEVVRQSRRLYEVICERLHSEALGGTLRIPAELFQASGRPTMIAFAALARFGGRDLSLYQFGALNDLPIRLPVLRSVSATEAEVKESGILPPVCSALPCASLAGEAEGGL